MMGLRVLMFGFGLEGACIYLANLKEVRALTESAHHLDDEVIESEQAADEGS